MQVKIQDHCRKDVHFLAASEREIGKINDRTFIALVILHFVIDLTCVIDHVIILIIIITAD